MALILIDPRVRLLYWVVCVVVLLPVLGVVPVD